MNAYTLAIGGGKIEDALQAVFFTQSTLEEVQNGYIQGVEKLGYQLHSYMYSSNKYPSMLTNDNHLQDEVIDKFMQLGISLAKLGIQDAIINKENIIPLLAVVICIGDPSIEIIPLSSKQYRFDYFPSDILLFAPSLAEKEKEVITTTVGGRTAAQYFQSVPRGFVSSTARRGADIVVEDINIRQDRTDTGRQNLDPFTSALERAWADVTIAPAGVNTDFETPAEEEEVTEEDDETDRDIDDEFEQLLDSLETNISLETNTPDGLF